MTKTIIDSDWIFEEAQKLIDQMDEQKKAEQEDRPVPPIAYREITPIYKNVATRKGLITVEDLESQEENTKILYELLKFYGRDANIHDMYGLFKTIMKKNPNPKKALRSEEYQKPNDQETRSMFITALSELKYMGYLSQTR